MANGLKKSKDDIIEDDVQISEEAFVETPKAKASKDAFAIPQLKEKETVTAPGHTRRDFRN
jgi:hypothetical protein